MMYVGWFSIFAFSSSATAFQSFQKVLSVTPKVIEVTRTARRGVEEDSDECVPIACLIGYFPKDKECELKETLQNAGFEYSQNVNDDNAGRNLFEYTYMKSSGMLKLVGDNQISSGANAPRYIPLQLGEENVLVTNGWSFLDPDESEPLSAFAVDADNLEKQYEPKWKMDKDPSTYNTLKISSLGYDIQPMNSQDILSHASIISEMSTNVLLHGATDPPNTKRTNNGYDFSGSMVGIRRGIFTCAIGGIPLFTTNDLSPLTGSSGWLSFNRPISNEHIKLVTPDEAAIDKRIEVLDSRSRCHLGHFFGMEDGYCINASAMNFFPLDEKNGETTPEFWDTSSHPTSWQRLGLSDDNLDVSEQILKGVLSRRIVPRTVLLGAGCFWHVELALRRLPGVLDTLVGYAGGDFASPSYEDVCKKQTNHAEVVRVTFDPAICDARKLLDCFLAMHDPTRFHGKRDPNTGQYRSCILTYEPDLDQIASAAVADYEAQLAKIVATEVKCISPNGFWVAEDRHQRHDERVKRRSGSTLSEDEWLKNYARRSSSIWGSSAMIPEDMDDKDDGMARMMI